jgi:hypothetical protein
LERSAMRHDGIQGGAPIRAIQRHRHGRLT